MKRLLLFFCFATAVAAEQIFAQDSEHEKEMKHISWLRERMQTSKGDEKEIFIELIGCGLRAHIFCLPFGKASYSREHYIEFVRPYLNNIFNNFYFIKFDVIEDVIEDILHSLIGAYPESTDEEYKRLLIRLECKVALHIGFLGGNAERIIVAADDLTREFFRTQLNPEAREALKAIEKIPNSFHKDC